MKHFNKNFIVNNGFLRGDESKLFFDGEPVEFVNEDTTIIDLLVKLEVFPSKG